MIYENYYKKNVYLLSKDNDIFSIPIYALFVALKVMVFVYKLYKSKYSSLPTLLKTTKFFYKSNIITSLIKKLD